MSKLNFRVLNIIFDIFWTKIGKFILEKVFMYSFTDALCDR